MEQKTVIAAFDRPGVADEALEALLENGFTRGQVRLGSSDALTDDAQVATSTPGTSRTLGEKIAHFFGLDDDDAAYSYSEAMRRGSTAVVVDAEDEAEAQRASNILSRFDPIDIDRRVSEWEATGWRRPGLEADPAARATDPSRVGERSTIPVVEERLQVGKRVVQGGGVRVFTRTRQVPVEERVELREERATVSRRPADRPVTDADRPFEDRSLEVHESREEPVVGKTARVVEEVVVGKETRRREEAVRDSVRKTEVEVQQAAQDPKRTPRQRD